MLNANAITQGEVLTVEGFESNFALGHLGRALLTWQLQEVLETTPDAQVMTVVGLNVERPDFNDLTMAQAFSAQSAHWPAGSGPPRCSRPSSISGAESP